MSEPMMATPTMAKVGVNWLDIKGFAEHLVHELQAEGETAIDLVDTAIKLVQAATQRDYVAIFAALNKGEKDIQEIIDSIRSEFGL